MGSLHHKVADLVPDEKLNCFFIFDAQLFTKQNELSFIRDQWSHLEDDASHCCRKVFLGSAQPINRNQAFLAQEKIFLRSAGKAVTKKTSSCYDFVFKFFFARKKSLSRCVVIRRSNDAKNFLMTFFVVAETSSTKNRQKMGQQQSNIFRGPFKRFLKLATFPNLEPILLITCNML